MRINLSIRNKLIATLSLFLLPIGLFASLYVLQSMKSVDFAELERNGVAYAQAVWPILSQATKEQLAADAGDAASSLTAASERYAGPLNAKDAASVLQDQLGAADRQARITAAQALIDRIADTSNLVLDPDLDSFFLMDAIVVKLPDALESAYRVKRRAQTEANRKDLSNREIADGLIELGKFQSDAAGVQQSLTKAFEANAGGRLQSALGERLRTFQRLTSDLAATAAAAADARADGKQDQRELAELSRSSAAFAGAADATWRDGMEGLDDLLRARIDGFYMAMRLALTLGVGVALAAFVVAWFLARSIVKALSSLGQRVRSLADMHLDAEVPEANGRDEVADLARAVVHFRDRTIEKIEDASNRDRSVERDAWVKYMVDISDRIMHAASGAMSRFKQLADEMKSSTDQVKSNAADTRERLTGTVESLAVSATDISGVAAAVTQLSSSISEIAARAAQSTSSMQAAKERADAARTLALQLDEASERIGSVTDLISKIASQTNLLALNATIEAASAGAAGKGFGVVASEVKALANQTTQATEDIGRQVAALKSASQHVLGAIGGITGTVTEISSVAYAIASAVEEQSATTAEIDANVQSASTRTRGAIDDLAALPKAARETDRLAGAVAALAGELMSEADKFRGELDAVVRAISDRRAYERSSSDVGIGVIVDGARREARLENVSETGARVSAPGLTLAPGKRFALDLGDGRSREVEVIYVEGDVYGLKFLERDRIDRRQVASLAAASSAIAA